jgi:ferredoxin
MKVDVDLDRCRGHGICWGLCPQVFDLTDDGWAEVLVDEVPPELEDKVHEAVRSCPEKAISVSDDGPPGSP